MHNMDYIRTRAKSLPRDFSERELVELVEVLESTVEALINRVLKTCTTSVLVQSIYGERSKRVICKNAPITQKCSFCTDLLDGKLIQSSHA